MGNLTVPQLVKKLEAFYGTLTVLTVLTGVRRSTNELNEFAPHS